MTRIEELQEIKKILVALKDKGESKIILTINEVLDIIEDNIQLILEKNEKIAEVPECTTHHLWSL